jgi:hypothetical protein
MPLFYPAGIETTGPESDEDAHVAARRVAFDEHAAVAARRCSLASPPLAERVAEGEGEMMDVNYFCGPAGVVVAHHSPRPRFATYAQDERDEQPRQNVFPH